MSTTKNKNNTTAAAADIGKVTTKFGNKFIMLSKKSALLAANVGNQLILKQLKNLLMLLLKPIRIFVKKINKARFGDPDAAEIQQTAKEVSKLVKSNWFKEKYKQFLKLLFGSLIKPAVAVGANIAEDVAGEVADSMEESSNKILAAPLKSAAGAAAGVVAAVPGAGAVIGAARILTMLTKFLEAILAIIKLPICGVLGVSNIVVKLGSQFQVLAKPIEKLLKTSKPALKWLIKKAGPLGKKIDAAKEVHVQAGGAKQPFVPDMTLYFVDNFHKRNRTRRKRKKRKRKSRRAE